MLQIYIVYAKSCTYIIFIKNMNIYYISFILYMLYISNTHFFIRKNFITNNPPKPQMPELQSLKTLIFPRAPQRLQN